MQKVKISDEADRLVLWKKLDKNGDGVVDLSEVEAMVADLVKSGAWPSWLGNETALEKAYRQTLADSIDGDDQIEKEEFHALLLNIFWFGKLHDVFEDIAQNDEEQFCVWAAPCVAQSGGRASVRTVCDAQWWAGTGWMGSRHVGWRGVAAGWRLAAHGG